MYFRYSLMLASKFYGLVCLLPFISLKRQRQIVYNQRLGITLWVISQGKANNIPLLLSVCLLLSAFPLSALCQYSKPWKCELNKQTNHSSVICVSVTKSYMSRNVLIRLWHRMESVATCTLQHTAQLLHRSMLNLSNLNLFLWPAIFHYIYSADSPLLWIRIDPDMSILRKVEFEQADFMWQYQLRYERDVVAQVGSLQVCRACCSHSLFPYAFMFITFWKSPL